MYFIRWGAIFSIQVGSISAVVFAHSLFVSISCSAIIQGGFFLNREEFGEMKNFVPLLPWYSFFWGFFSPMWDSSPASRDVCMAVSLFVVWLVCWGRGIFSSWMVSVSCLCRSCHCLIFW